MGSIRRLCTLLNWSLLECRLGMYVDLNHVHIRSVLELRTFVRVPEIVPKECHIIDG